MCEHIVKSLVVLGVGEGHFWELFLTLLDYLAPHRVEEPLILPKVPSFMSMAPILPVDLG